MEDGAWVKMMKSLKRISLATLLIPFLVSPIKDTEKIHHSQTLEKIIQEQLSIINNEIIYSNAGPKISEINQDTLSYYEKYYKKISSLIDHLEEKGFQLENLLQDPRFEIYEGVRNRFKHSAEKKSLTLKEYKELLEYEDKKNKISGFINDNIDQLKSAEKTYGISKYITSATIAIESDFGENKGSFNPFNAYFSMYANNYKKEFASAQLEELLIFCEKNNIDIFSLKSSYAGAISYAQFLPSSLNKWFVGDDLYDMNNNILSVANYLSYFKKRTGSLKQAIFRYNPSKLYVGTILDLAKDAEEILSSNK